MLHKQMHTQTTHICSVTGWQVLLLLLLLLLTPLGHWSAR